MKSLQAHLKRRITHSARQRANYDATFSWQRVDALQFSAHQQHQQQHQQRRGREEEGVGEGGGGWAKKKSREAATADKCGMQRAKMGDANMKMQFMCNENENCQITLLHATYNTHTHTQSEMKTKTENATN